MAEMLDGMLDDLTPGLVGFSAEVSGWDSPAAGLGIAAIVLTLVALAYAALKFSFPPRAPLPAWYKEGWVVAVVGSLCTLVRSHRLSWVPFGGLAAWSWRPGSLLLLGGWGRLSHCRHRHGQGSDGRVSEPRQECESCG